jgi:hypothetical protein
MLEHDADGLLRGHVHVAPAAMAASLSSIRAAALWTLIAPPSVPTS